MGAALDLPTGIEARLLDFFTLGDDAKRALARQKTHHRHVIDHGRDARRHAKTRGQTVEAASDGGLSRQDEGFGGQHRGKGVMLQAIGLPVNAHCLLGDAVRGEFT